VSHKPRFSRCETYQKRQRPIAFFNDNAHDLHGKPLFGLKRLFEIVRDSRATISVVLAGHP
jgi:type II secretory pathway predicted ATPase ExeA